MIPGTPPALIALTGPAGPAGESQGGTTIILAMRNPERLRGGPDLAPDTLPTSPEPDLAWQLPASTAPSRLGQDIRSKRKGEGTIRYREAREDGYIRTIGVSQPRE